MHQLLLDARRRSNRSVLELSRVATRSVSLAASALGVCGLLSGCGSADSPQGLESASAERGASVERLEQAIALPATTRRVAVLMLHYGQPPSYPTREYLNDLIFASPTSVKAYYAEASFGAVQFEGDVFDWIQTERTPTCDDPNGIRARALPAAAAAGIDLSSYDHVLFWLADNCRSGGSAQIGTPSNPGRYSYYWSTTFSPIFAHELGHNFGFAHTDALDCSPVTLQNLSACTELSSSDHYDPMGNAFATAHFQAFHKATMGWLAGCNVVTSRSGGEFELAPLEVATDAIQAIRVPVPDQFCPRQQTPCFYYVEYRQPIGFDGRFPFDSSPIHDGALVRIGPEIDRVSTTFRSTFVLDMTPRPPTATVPALFDSPLLVGQTFEDPAGTRISVLSESNQRLRVRVEVPNGAGGSTCLDGTSTCTDGIRNALESDVDCGPGCSPCADGRTCTANADCASGNCSAGLCAPARVTARFHLSSESSARYCGEIMVRNVSDSVVHGYRVDVALAQSRLTDHWNAVFTPVSGSLYRVTPPPWNDTIQPGNEVGLGFCADKLGPNFTPVVLSASTD